MKLLGKDYGTVGEVKIVRPDTLSIRSRRTPETFYLAEMDGTMNVAVRIIVDSLEPRLF